MSGSPLFVVYPPILAQQNGIPLSDLAIYYPVYGILLVGSRFLISRVLTRTSFAPSAKPCTNKGTLRF